MIGMILIGLGTGGIKPCVSAFGGDQYTSQQVGCLHTLFSVLCYYVLCGDKISK